MKQSMLMWRRTDLPGFERLVLEASGGQIFATGTVLSAEADGLRLDHHWRLDCNGRAQSVGSHGVLRLERVGAGWIVNGEPRPDLDGAEEPDLSVTPFCNILPIRRTGIKAGDSRQLDTAFIDGAALTVARSRQRYDRQGFTQLRC